MNHIFLAKVTFKNQKIQKSYFFHAATKATLKKRSIRIH